MLSLARTVARPTLFPRLSAVCAASVHIVPELPYPYDVWPSFLHINTLCDEEL